MTESEKHNSFGTENLIYEFFLSNNSGPKSEAEALFFEIYNSSIESIFIHDLEGKILTVNDFTVKLFGYNSTAEIVNLSIDDVSAGDLFSVKSAKEYWEKAVLGTPQNFEWQAKKKNGTLFWVEVTLRYLNFNRKEIIFATVRDITQRKKTEEDLAESENFLRSAQTITHTGIYKLNVATGYWSSSHVLDKIFGIEKDYVKSVEGWANIIHPDWQPIMVDYFANYVIKGKNRFDKEYQIVRKTDKEVRWVHGIGDLTFDDAGNPVFMIGTIRDITDKKLDQQAIEKAAAEQNAMLANIADVIAIMDKNGITTYKSPNVEKWFGWKPEDVIGKSTWQNIHPDDLIATQSVFSKVLSTENSVLKSECRYLCKDGSYKWIEYTASNLLNDKYIKGILLNYHDISDRKDVAQALQSEQLLSKAVLESLPGIFYLYSYPDLRLIKWNKNHETQLGFSTEEMANKTIMDFHVSEAKEAVKAAVDYVMQEGANAIEANLVAKDGTQIPYLLTGVRFEMNGELFLVGVGIDIIERKKFETKLIEKSNELNVQNEEYQQLNKELIDTNKELIVSKEKAEESDRLKTSFLQNMSHEIITPMNAIMGFSELMVNAYNNKEKLTYYSQIVNRRCNDLLSIINDILDISKIESGQLTVVNEKCNIKSLLTDVKLTFEDQQNILNKEHITFILEIPSELDSVTILTDGVKLQQILTNLVGNAFKFTSKGKITIGCTLKESDKIVFYVADTGIGIPKDKHEFIFERFAQYNEDKKVLYGGTGLGLSIVKGLVEHLHGDIWLESQPGIGSTFYVSLPFTSEIQPTLHSSFSKSIEYSFKNQTILVVEDEPFNMMYVKEILSDFDLTILSAENGMEAIRIALNNEINLVLMDIRLPDISGHQATKEILKVKPDMKIIAQTAYAAPEDKRLSMEAGCIDYISKPIKRDIILSTLSKYLIEIP